MSDLADSSQIERDADAIALLQRDPTAEGPGPNATLFLAKQRDGETGIIPLHFNAPYCRFENYTSQDPE
jgi:replicative DNA helicase